MNTPHTRLMVTLSALAAPSLAFAEGCPLFSSASCFGKNLAVALAIALPLTLISAGGLMTMVMQGFVRRRTPWMPAVGLTLPVSLIAVVAVGQGLARTSLFDAQHHVWALIAWAGASALLQLGYVVLCAWLLDARPPKVGE